MDLDQLDDMDVSYFYIYKVLCCALHAQTHCAQSLNGRAKLKAKREAKLKVFLVAHESSKDMHLMTHLQLQLA